LDLAGTLDTDAVIRSDGLWGEAVVYDHYAPVIEAIKDDIGVSIRAWANVEYGEAKGRKGPIITEFTEAASVDYVTTPGAGGRVTALLESARGQARLEPAEQLIETTISDRREQIERALPERSYLRDYDPDKLEAYFTTYDRATDKAITYAQSYTIGEDDQSVTLAGDPYEVRVVTTYVPVSSAGQATTESNPEKELIKMPEIPADRLAELEKKERDLAEAVKAAEEAKAAAAEADRKAAEAEAKIAAGQLQEAARKRVTEKTGDVHPNVRARVTETLTADAASIPVKDGALDVPGLDAKIAEAITAEQEYLKPFAPKGVTGFGQSTATEADPLTESEPEPVNAWGRSRSTGKIEIKKGA
jgi:hypothetical protein